MTRGARGSDEGEGEEGTGNHEESPSDATKAFKQQKKKVGVVFLGRYTATREGDDFNQIFNHIFNPCVENILFFNGLYCATELTCYLPIIPP